MTTIRQARFQDIPGIAVLANEALYRSEYAAFAKLDLPALRASLSEAIGDKARSLVLVAENSERIDGVFVGNISHLYCTDVLTAGNTFFYVSPKASKSTALRLIRGFMAWVESADQPIRYRLGMSGVITDLGRLDRMMGKMGFRLAGGIYEKEN